MTTNQGRSATNYLPTGARQIRYSGVSAIAQPLRDVGAIPI